MQKVVGFDYIVGWKDNILRIANGYFVPVIYNSKLIVCGSNIIKS